MNTMVRYFFNHGLPPPPAAGRTGRAAPGTERIVEVPRERLVERVVEKLVEVPVEYPVERVVEKIVEVRVGPVPPPPRTGWGGAPGGGYLGGW